MKENKKEKYIFSEKDFGLRLAKVRESQNISARALSLSLSRNKNYINQIESHKFLPSLNEFFEICDKLNISPRDFFDPEVKTTNDLDEFIHCIQKMTPEQSEALYYFLKSLNIP